MIDYLKIHELPVKAGEILNDDRLTFPLSNVATTGELLNRAQVAHWQNLNFRVKGERVNLQGSLHKHHEGGTNHKDYFLADIQVTIKKLAEMFYFDPQRAQINFIEIGINIELENDPTRLIKTLVMYRNKPFEQLHVKGKGFGRKCENQQFTIKVYNKSLQYGLQHHLLRFEVKVKKMKFLERYGITRLALADLKKPETYHKLKTLLLDVWAGILIYDPNTNPDQITNQKNRELFISGRFAEFWGTIDRYQRHRKMKRFSEIAGGEPIKQEISELIKQKWNKLTICSQPEKTQQNNHLQETAESEKMQQINTTIKGYSNTCIITGLELKNQRPGTKYLSAKGIKFYHENDPETYREKLETLLTDKWKQRHERDILEKWFNEIYHQIRNRANNPRNNPRNNTKKSYQQIESKGLKLWPTEKLADPKKMELIMN